MNTAAENEANLSRARSDKGEQANDTARLHFAREGTRVHNKKQTPKNASASCPERFLNRGKGGVICHTHADLT